MTRLAFSIFLLAFFVDAGAIAQDRQQRSRRRERVVPMQEVVVTSPGGSLSFVLHGNPERLTFHVQRDDVTVLDPSPIVMMVGGYDLSAGVVFKNLERFQTDNSYPWYGVKSTAVDRCNGARITLQNDLTMENYLLEIRSYDDGVAFRHIIPGPVDTVRTPDERTTFVVPMGASVWYHDLDGHYEAEYRKKPAEEVTAGEWGGPPVTYELPRGGGYASITEANVVNYAGMALESDGRRGLVVGLGHRQPMNWPYELRYGREEAKRLGYPATVTGTIATPWRVLIAGKDLNTLVNSTILPNLCPSPDPDLFPAGIKTSWIRPGRAVWRYVDGGERGFEAMKSFSRLASELGFEHHVIEGDWARWPDEQKKEIASYSASVGVGVFFWKHSRDLRTPELREDFFSMLERFGVAGAKIDFFDHDAKEVVDVYEEILRSAAKHRILVVFHGSNKPTGRERTWPNELVRESVRGMESSGLQDRARHQTILPFTRYLAGHADYTTMIFSERRRNSTWAHQIGTMVLFHSPLLTIAAHPGSILNNPAAEVIRSIPPVWDETIVLPDSKIGELAVYARRSGNNWFVAAINGGKAAAVNIPLTFLAGGSYEGRLVRDGKATPASVTVDRSRFDRNDVLSVSLADGGGFVAMLMPAK